MFPQTLPRKLVQISEEALPPVQVPLILGHDLFILSYQDIRKIEDSRVFNVSKLMPNGVLKSLDIKNPYEWLLDIFKQQNLLNDANFCQLWEFLNNKRKYEEFQQQLKSYSCGNYPQPMEVSYESQRNPLVASIDQQLKWDKCVNTSAPFPMTYSCGTSTTDINFQENNNCKDSTINSNTCCNCLNCKSSKVTKHLCHKSINTLNLSPATNLDAREQLKKKKINFSFPN